MSFRRRLTAIGQWEAAGQQWRDLPRSLGILERATSPEKIHLFYSHDSFIRSLSNVRKTRHGGRIMIPLKWVRKLLTSRCAGSPPATTFSNRTPFGFGASIGNTWR